MKKLYAILPCYNEEENIGKLIEEWEKQKEKLKKTGYELKIIAINDASTDKTKEEIIKEKQKHDNVELIEHEQNEGLCGGINTAIQYFMKNGTKDDLLTLMDGDNTHNPKYVHEMLEKIKQGNTCVIASRYKEKSKIVGLAKNRELMSNFAKIYYSSLLKIPKVKDYTCGYRTYTYEIIENMIKKFGKNPIKEKSFACMMELLYKVYKAGAKFEEVGFELRYDQKGGESKMKVAKTAERSLITALKLKCRYDIGAIFSLICIILFSIFLSLGTNFSPTSNLMLSHDCGIFSYVGYAMSQGRALYREVWENKGPLLYIIYYVGEIINETNGIYIMELISIILSTLFAYKTIKIITQKRIYSVLGLIYTFSAWVVIYEGGTFSESFALPILMAGVYLFTKKTLQNETTSNLEISLWGILTGLIAMLRLNMLSIFLAFYIVIGIDLIRKKEIKEIFRWIKFGLLGFIISIIPVLIYLITNNCLLECLNSAYFNIMERICRKHIYTKN